MTEPVSLMQVNDHWDDNPLPGSVMVETTKEIHVPTLHAALPEDASLVTVAGDAATRVYATGVSQEGLQAAVDAHEGAPEQDPALTQALAQVRAGGDLEAKELRVLLSALMDRVGL